MKNNINLLGQYRLGSYFIKFYFHKYKNDIIYTVIFDHVYIYTGTNYILAFNCFLKEIIEYNKDLQLQKII